MDPIDWKSLSDNCAGDEGLVGEVVALFRNEGPGLFADVAAAVQRSDAPAIKRTAHKLKGALLSLGATDAVALARALEDAGTRGELEGARELSQRLEAELTRVQAALARR